MRGLVISIRARERRSTQPPSATPFMHIPALQNHMDITLLFSTRIIRLFCYGFLSVVLALYLSEAGLTEGQIGLLFTLTLVGDAVISLWLTTSADRFGRKRTLILGALLMAGAGVAFVLTRNVILLMIAAIVGVISPSGNEIGPFLSVEQAGLTQLVPNKKRTQFFAWYALVGSFATATGAPDGRLARTGVSGQCMDCARIISCGVDWLCHWRISALAAISQPHKID